MPRKTTVLMIFATLLSCFSVAAQDAPSQPHPDKAAAIAHVRKAQAASQAGDHRASVAHWEAAVKLAPDNLDYHYQLAIAYMNADRLPDMWRILHIASAKDLTHEDISRALLSYWKMRGDQGLFNVGVPMRDVLEALGKPDHFVRRAQLKRCVYGFMAVEFFENRVHQTLDLRGMTEDHFRPHEIVRVDMDGRGRRVGHRTANRYVTLAEYVLPDEQVQNWTELFSIQRMHGMAKTGKSMTDLAAELLDVLAKTHPKRKFRFINEAEGAVIYEWKIAGSDGVPAQHEIVCLLRGAVDVHRVAFVVKRDEINPQVRAGWIETFRHAALQVVMSDKELPPTSSRNTGRP